MPSFIVPEKYTGKTLDQIGQEVSAGGGYIPRLDVLSSQAGISSSAPLTAGQSINFNGDSGSGEYQFLNTNFTPQAAYQQNQTANTLRESSTNAINTLKSGQAPLDARYQDLIGNIRATSAQETGRADVTSAQELARRGIPTSSTYAGEYQQSKRIPIQTAFQGQEAAAQLSAQQAVENRNSAIANIQQATGLNEVNAAMEAYRQGEQTRQFNESLAFQKSEAAKPAPQAASDPYAQFKTLSEGQSIIDLLSGNSIYSAPKTYKAGSGGEGNRNPGGI